MESQACAADAESYEKLVEWICQSHGGFVHQNLRLKGSGSARGVFAVKEISKGETLVSLPANRAVSGSQLPVSYNNDRSVSSWLRCIAAYMEARLKGHHFQPYLESLPLQYESLLDWSNEEIERYLAGTALCRLVMQDRQEKILETRYREAVRPYLFHLGLLTKEERDGELQEFRMACMCVSTRGFHLEDKDAVGSYSGPFLLPWIDLLNHDPRQKCTTLKWDRNKNCFYMEAERDIAATEEVYHSYGTNLTSAQVLKTFGFVPEESVQAAINGEMKDEISPAMLSKWEVMSACQAVAKSSFPSRLRSHMSSTADDEEERWELKHDMTTRDLSSLPDEFLISGNEPLSEELVTTISVLLLPEEVYSEFAKDGITRLDMSVLDDFYLGKLACQCLAYAVAEKLATFVRLSIAGSEDDNEDSTLLQRLGGQPKFARAVYGLTIRLEEKRCLTTLLSKARSVCASLGGIPIDCGEPPGKKIKKS